VTVAHDRIQAFQVESGERLWERPIETTGPRLPAVVAPEAAYVATGDGRLISVSLADGSPRWTRTLPGDLGQPLAAAGTVFVGSTGNQFHALDGGDGHVRWSWRTGGDVVGAAAGTQLMFFVALDNILRAVNPGNGHQRWKQALPTRALAPPVALAGHVVVAGLDPALSSFDALTGSADGTFAVPTIADAGAPAEILGQPLVDVALKPFRVSSVVVLRDGRVVALRAQSMLFREPVPVPLPALPGRVLGREPAPQLALP
jgi:outer membrane protein assembly factor BamB